MRPSYFFDLENREKKEVVPGVAIRTIWQDRMLLSIVDLEAGAVVPLHSHEHEQAGAVLSGDLELTIDGETRLLKPGDSYIIPGGVAHKAVAVNGPARVLDVFAPVREEYKY